MFSFLGYACKAIETNFQAGRHQYETTQHNKQVILTAMLIICDKDIKDITREELKFMLNSQYVHECFNGAQIKVMKDIWNSNLSPGDYFIKVVKKQEEEKEIKVLEAEKREQEWEEKKRQIAAQKMSPQVKANIILAVLAVIAVVLVMAAILN